MAYPDGKPDHVNAPFTEDDVVHHVKSFLKERVDACVVAGMVRENIVIDPGMGAGSFGKDLKQNLMLLSRLDELSALNLPMLVGISRKTFIGELLNREVSERLSGGLAATMVAAEKGAHIIRTHDVKATVDVLKMIHAIKGNKT